MGKLIWVPGPTQVYVGPHGSSVGSSIGTSCVPLGYTRGGVDFEEHEFTINVPTDLNGGEDGTPTDRQFFGIVAVGRLDLTEFDQAVANYIRQRLADNGSSNRCAGKVLTADIGALKIQGGFMYRCLLNNANLPYNFVMCEFSEPIGANIGTKFESLQMVVTAYRDPGTNTDYAGNATQTGVIYNQLTS